MDAEKQYTVLIVDDNPDLLRLLSMGLPDMGNYEVVTAADGIEGLTKFFEVRPDCMVIDVMMPGLDGVQLVRTLRGDPDSAFTPLIMLTAMVQDKDKFIGMAAGVDQYLTKPVMTSELAKAIEYAIHLADAEREKFYRSLAEEQLSDNAAS